LTPSLVTIQHVSGCKSSSWSITMHDPLPLIASLIHKPQTQLEIMFLRLSILQLCDYLLYSKTIPLGQLKDYYSSDYVGICHKMHSHNLHSEAIISFCYCFNSQCQTYMAFLYSHENNMCHNFLPFAQKIWCEIDS
jgi:hypothetical protein